MDVNINKEIQLDEILTNEDIRIQVEKIEQNFIIVGDVCICLKNC